VSAKTAVELASAFRAHDRVRASIAAASLFPER
jgi:hypothetical protein